MQLHLDPLGGIAGDMMVAALLDLRPDLENGLADALSALPLLDGVSAELVAHNDGTLAGRRFLVTRRDDQQRHGVETHHHHGDGHDHDHHYIAWRDIRGEIAASPLAPAVIRYATGIFAMLAEAEGRVHGVAPDDVHFHEVGAWDSVADIVAAAFLIDAFGVTATTVGPVPLGSGRVRTAHGPLPVPAPATALLLEGFGTIDDGIVGERVTPTGAAILRYLCKDTPTPGPRKLAGSGFGFGTKTLPGISNCLRVLAFQEAEAGPGRSRVAVLEFEVDDQTGEDLAEGLDRLRAHAGVLDVVQAPVFGKKGRVMAHVRILARPEALDTVLAAAFDETATIGIRHRIVERAELRRELHEVEIDGRKLRRKSADRPGGRSFKAEAEDIAPAGGRLAREALRRKAETP